MRLGVSLPSMGSNPDPRRLAMVAQEAEAHEFHSVWVPDHVLRVFGPILDPLTVLSFVAGATQRVGLGTNVLIVPYRHPLILANEAASLDVLSGGRFVFGVVAGHPLLLWSGNSSRMAPFYSQTAQQTSRRLAE